MILLRMYLYLYGYSTYYLLVVVLVSKGHQNYGGKGSSITPCNVFPSKNMELENPMINVCEMIESDFEVPYIALIYRNVTLSSKFDSVGMQGECTIKEDQN